MPLVGLSEVFSPELQEILKFLFSGVSLLATLYFWLVRANRERVALAVHAVHGFEGCLQDDGTGVWTGKLFLANRSILATAVLAGRAELWWQGRWLVGGFHAADGSELPWNLPPAQVFAKDVIAAFDLGREATREQVYAEQRLRFTFVTVEGRRVVVKLRSKADGAGLFKARAA
jgi:hypothetical protein